MAFISFLTNYNFTLILVPHSGFINLSFHNFILNNNSQNTAMVLGAHMCPYSYMYCSLSRDRGVTQCIYRNSVVCFQEQKDFILKTVILLAFGLGMCEGVGEDSRHEIGHVDIQVGS